MGRDRGHMLWRRDFPGTLPTESKKQGKKHGQKKKIRKKRNICYKGAGQAGTTEQGGWTQPRKEADDWAGAHS